MKRVKRKSTTILTPWREKALMAVLLAMAAGTMIFLFYLSSTDVKKSQAASGWSQKISLLLDQMCQDISSAVLVDHPFSGVSNQCVFRRPLSTGALEPSLDAVGFVFAENTLQHTVKTASGTILPKNYGGWENPLLTGVQNLQFERVKARLLRISLKVKLPDTEDGVKDFERLVFLKNQ
jgi:hypothetical protein